MTLLEFTPWLDVFGFWFYQDPALACGIFKAECQDFGVERPHTLDRKIDHTTHQRTREFLFSMRAGRLHAGVFNSNLRPKVNPQFVGGFPRLGEVLDINNPTDPYIHLLKILVGNHFVFLQKTRINYFCWLKPSNTCAFGNEARNLPGTNSFDLRMPLPIIT